MALLGNREGDEPGERISMTRGGGAFRHLFFSASITEAELIPERNE